MKVCYDPYVDYKHLPALTKTLMEILQGPQLLCNQNIGKLEQSSVPHDVGQIASCNSLYNVKVTKCTERFQNMFEVVPSSHCKEYKRSKDCIDDARRSHCSVAYGGLDILKDHYNPFCSNETNPQDPMEGVANTRRTCHVMYLSLLFFVWLLLQ